MERLLNASGAAVEATPSKKRRAATAASGPSAPPLGGKQPMAPPAPRDRVGLPALAVAGENPLLVALGGTPRSRGAAAPTASFPTSLEPEPLDLSQPAAVKSASASIETKPPAPRSTESTGKVLVGCAGMQERLCV